MNSKLIILCVLVSLCPCVLVTYAQDDYLEVKGNTKADSVDFDTFTGDTGGLPSTPVEGELFYDFTAGVKQPKYYDGAWKTFGGAATKTVATKIVAASNSLGTTGCPAACANPRADYTCDGTDDQTTIQTAINALGTTGGAVYLLEGTYNISSSINLDNVANLPDDLGNDSNKSIIGAGKGTVLKLTAALSTTGVIKTYCVDKILISNLMIDGNNKLGDYVAGIWLNATNYSKIANVWIENMSGNGITFGYSSGAQYNTITNNHIQFNNHRGICNTFGGVAGWADVSNNIISHNVISSNGRDGINVYTYGGASFKNNVISSNTISSNGPAAVGWGSGIVIDGYCGNVYNNVISNNDVSSNSSGGIGLVSYCWNSIVVGNIVYNNTYTGITVNDGTNYSVVSGNVVVSNKQWGIAMAGSSNVITGNIISENSKDGVYNSTWSLWGHNNIICGNRIYKSGAASSYYGIKIWSGIGNYIFGNLIDGTGWAGAINDSGASTKYTDKIKMTLEKKTISTSGNYTLDVATSPQTYISFIDPTGAITLTLANGKSAGDLLILENTTANSVSLSEGANVNLGATPRALDQYDTLELIWNGTVAEGGTGKWLEVKWVDN